MLIFPSSANPTSLNLLQLIHTALPIVSTLSGNAIPPILLYAKPSSPMLTNPSFNTTSLLLEYAKAAVPIDLVDESTVYSPARPAG